MDLSPRILGVSAAVLVAGVTAGAALGTVPPMQQRGALELLPEAHTISFTPRAQGPLPDHYPLITRAGRFEVEQLAERGLYSQARYAWHTAYPAYDPAAEWADDGGEAAAWQAEAAAEAEPAAVQVAQADAAAGAEQAPAVDPASAPLAPVGVAVAEVRPRVIDVEAELARRY